MRKAWAKGVRWKALVVGCELAVAAGCVLLGWQVLHDSSLASAVGRARTVVTRAPARAPGMAGPGSLPFTIPVGPIGAPAASPPAVSDILQRAGRDDVLMYRGQWQVIELLAAGVHQYLVRHVLPLLLAAARGGIR